MDNKYVSLDLSNTNSQQYKQVEKKNRIVITGICVQLYIYEKMQ